MNISNNSSNVIAYPSHVEIALKITPEAWTPSRVLGPVLATGAPLAYIHYDTPGGV